MIDDRFRYAALVVGTVLVAILLGTGARAIQSTITIIVSPTTGCLSGSICPGGVAWTSILDEEMLQGFSQQYMAELLRYSPPDRAV
jgi:hypothetical protein